MKDKQFKAVNREENYIKNNAPDMRLGRHSETAPQPRQSTSRKMKKYQARQPTIGAESAAVPEQQDYGGYTADTGNTDTDLQISNSDTVHYAENADLQVTPRNKNRIYQKHTQFAQKTADYDFAKENQTQDFSFTDTTETYSPDTAEQPENVAEETADIPQNHLEGGAQTEPPKRSHKQYYHSHNPRREKDADFNISETSKETDYSFTDVKSDTSFDRSERKTGDNEKPTDKAVRKRIYQTQRDNTAKEPAAETEPSEDYDISDAVKNADKPFDYVSDSGSADSRQTAKHKKNARLQEKRRLQTDDTVSSGTADGNDKSESTDNTTADNGKDDFQFKRAAKAERRAEKAQVKVDKAEEKLPHKKKIKRQRLYDEEKQKPKNRLVFENEIKPQKDLYHRTPVKAAVSEIGMQAANKVHSKINETENENAAVEGAHKTEQKAETLARYSARTARYIRQNKKAAPYKRAQRLRVKSEKLKINAAYQKTLAENPELKKSILKKFQQKQRIKKQYQKARQAEQGAKAAKNSAKAAVKNTVRITNFVARHKSVFAVIISIALMIGWLATTISSCAVMGMSGANSILTSSYLAEDEDIYLAEGYYAGLETDLRAELDNIETTYAGYDEYKYNLAQIGHNPYELISYLTAKYECFVFDDIQAELDGLFAQQYALTITEAIETRTDDAGGEYEYKVLNVTLTNNNLNMLANTNLTDDQRELYGIYLETKGNRDYLFADDIYSNAVTPPSYTIPGEALSDATFRRLITEAEKYLGYPYVWGGSSPSTSFDCSGFVCWVFKNSGVYPLERTTAQGICDQCAIIPRSEAKPGDIIFFTGTYNAGEPVTHVGIYVGDGMMIHCGNPIQYASIDTPYWTEHFYCFGRLN